MELYIPGFPLMSSVQNLMKAEMSAVQAVYSSILCINVPGFNYIFLYFFSVSSIQVLMNMIFKLASDSK